jgi:CheY-like chemotaxis protein
VDDDPAFLTVSKEIRIGIDSTLKVEVVSTVEEAIDKLEAQSYDVVVSDYELPEINGLEFLKRLRAQGNRIPFILFTGKDKEEIAKQALTLGADCYVNKPGNIEDTYLELSHSIQLITEKHKIQVCIDGYEKRYGTLISNANDNERIKTLFELLVREIEVLKMMANDLPFSRNDAELLTGFITDAIDQLHLVESEIFRLKTFLTKEGIV